MRLPQAAEIEELFKGAQLPGYSAEEVPYQAIAEVLAEEDRSTIGVYSSVVLALLNHVDGERATLQAIAFHLSLCLLPEAAKHELRQYVKRHDLPR